MALLWLAGCTPAGPRAVLRGEKLVREGQYADAIVPLETATQLLPQDARAWNFLGLAYHGAGRATDALAAYRRALELDRDLMATRYNLGCLLLEQNQPQAALEQLRTYVSHPRHATEAPAWLQLGTALMRAERWDDAAKVFAYLQQQPAARTPEVLNNLGVVQVRRRQFPEAAASFNAALDLDPQYGPALLNLATLYHQQPASRVLALRKYREYLALTPQPADWQTVSGIAAQLDNELNAVPVKPGSDPALTATAPPTNARPSIADVTANTPTNARTNGVEVAAAAKPSAATERTPSKPSSRKERVLPEPPPHESASTKTTATEPPTPAPTTPAPTPAPAGPAPSQPPAVTESTPIQPAPTPAAPATHELAVRPANDVTPAPPVAAVPATPPPPRPAPLKPSEDPALANIGKPPPPGTDPNFWSKLNPFDRPPSSPLAKPPTAPPGSSVARTTAPAAERRRRIQPGLAAARPTVPNSIPRYSYQSPPAPAAGNRTAAQRFFTEGLHLHEASQFAKAASFYQRAIELDPAYFEAHHNLALAAYRAGNLKLSLTAAEIALALQPDSAAARHQLAVGLQRRGYHLDALAELETILQAHPDDARAHLTLANLYAQQFHQPDRARAHYLQVLEHAPRHPEATTIRYWLAAHP